MNSTWHKGQSRLAPLTYSAVRRFAIDRNSPPIEQLALKPRPCLERTAFFLIFVIK
ncbi:MULTISPECIES: hypothetical protein [unclassified Microcoleus]|uniref:hypothetical protein n=1 Tax=unclassified Microcoleus TaxID=2642155 RepID=UPI0025CDE62D|nr:MULTISPECIES: hypothetical protein [unclassified Microcoleus]